MIGIISLLIDIFILLLFLHAVTSWMPPIRESRPYQLLDQLISPVLDPIRRVIPPVSGFDFSPLILVIILYLIKRLLFL